MFLISVYKRGFEVQSAQSPRIPNFFFFEIISFVDIIKHCYFFESNVLLCMTEYHIDECISFL